MKFYSLLAALLLAGCSASQSVAPAPSPKSATLDKMKALEGRWEGRDKDGQMTYVQFRPISADTAVEEVLFAGTTHEMTSIYHKDGDSLLLTHYCAAGNAPVLKAVDGNDSYLDFKYIGGTNLNPETDMHIHEMRLTWNSPSSIREEWIGYNKGMPQEATVLDLTRVTSDDKSCGHCSHECHHGKGHDSKKCPYRKG